MNKDLFRLAERLLEEGLAMNAYHAIKLAKAGKNEFNVPFGEWEKIPRL